MGRGGGEKDAVDVEAVVVGAGIAGLATALALRRAGVARDGGVVVLERHAGLRATGAALTIFPNGWFALRALGVAHKLTPRYEPYETSVVTNLESGATQVFRFGGHKSRSGEVKVRPVHRKALLEAMAEELPPGTIRFSSRLASIGTEPAGEGSSESELAVVRLEDGTVIRSKVLVGCVGVHSAVARWLGMSEPASSGRSCVRGLAVYPGGHNVKRELRQFLSHGLRAGMVPISDTDIYWFVVNNTIPAEREAGGDPEKILREVTDNLGRHLPEEFLDVARHSEPDNLTWAPLLYRAPWAILTGWAARGPVTVAGDAFHPMTPDMAQGGCAALEDAVVLARALSRSPARRHPAEGVAAPRGSSPARTCPATSSRGAPASPACAPSPSSCSATGSSTGSSSPCSPTRCGSTAATSSRRRRRATTARKLQARRAMHTETNVYLTTLAQSQSHCRWGRTTSTS